MYNIINSVETFAVKFKNKNANKKLKISKQDLPLFVQC